MKTKAGNAVHKILRGHHGREQAISSLDIALALNKPPGFKREVRRIIADEAALWPDVVICAVPGEGYFCAATFQELEEYHNWLCDLAKDAADKVIAFRRAAKQLGFNVNTLPPLKIAA